MSFDLVLKPSCSSCGITKKLYRTNCKHLTLCRSCGEAMAKDGSKCGECGAAVTRLIREFRVRGVPVSHENYFIGKFRSGLPDFSKNTNCKWSLQKEGLSRDLLINASKNFSTKYKKIPWLLKDETGQSQYHGVLEGPQSSTHYLLWFYDEDVVAIPVDLCYRFKRIARVKRQASLEEAELAMRKIRKTGKKILSNDVGEEDEENENKKSDYWDHDEVFSDDDEAVEIEPWNHRDSSCEIVVLPLFQL